MLRRIKLVLSYLEWLSVVGFVAVFGCLVLERSVTGAVLTWLVAVFLFWQIFHLSSRKRSDKIRISDDNYIANPFLDIILIIMCFVGFLESSEWYPLGVAGLVFVTVDIIRWVFLWFGKK